MDVAEPIGSVEELRSVIAPPSGPKADPAGFVRILDDHTVAIPDRPGNHRADTFEKHASNLVGVAPGIRN